MDRNTFVQEQSHLNNVTRDLAVSKKDLESSLQTIGVENLEKLKDLRENPETSGADFHFFLEQLHEKNAAFNFKDKYQRLEEFESSLREPYFARIDLKSTHLNKEKSVYIGKFGFTKEDKPVITDWRAKIASVYYRYRYPQKNVEYRTPEGTKVRDLTLKRTFEIDNGTLVKYYNNDIQLDESEIIAEKIEQRTGGVLEDIVETIQELQLDVIESDPRQVCIVQGCVGSGKSTVAIHKLSHIFFNYPNLIHPKRSILIAKNQILVGYLSTLFPKLGIFDINYKTLKDLVYNLVFRENLSIKINFDIPSNSECYSKDQIKKLQQKIDKIHKEYEKKIEKIFSSDDVESFAGFVYSDTQTVYENLSEAISDLEEELGYQKNLLKEHPNSPQEWLYQSNIEDLRKLINKLSNLRTELKEKTLPKIAEEAKLSIKQEMSYADTLLYLHIYSELIGFSKTQRYEYCIVDEGQDVSFLEYLVLDKFVLNGRFCILGDLNQGYQEEGIASWEDIYSAIKETKNANVFELTTNYRSTKPIVELATRILAPYTLDYLPNPINRTGASPEITIFRTPAELIQTFNENIAKDAQKLNKSVGVICFSKELFEQAKNCVKNTSIPAEKLIILDNQKTTNYVPRGIYLMNFEDCKGLEFAKVYVLGLNLNELETFNDAKKAFVSVTRAMNELCVYSLDKPEVL